MTERQPLQIEIIDISRRVDYCFVPLEQNVRKNLTKIMDLERQLSGGELNREQWDHTMVSHIRSWNNLPDYYKGVLSDLSAIEIQQ